MELTGNSRAPFGEDEYCVTVRRPMTREHHISFLAALSDRGLQLVKLYPEWEAEARFRIGGVQRIYAYRNRRGLFERRL